MFCMLQFACEKYGAECGALCQMFFCTLFWINVMQCFQCNSSRFTKKKVQEKRHYRIFSLNRLIFVKVLQGQLSFEILKLFIFNPIPIGLFLSNIDWGGGMFSTPPHDFDLVNIRECDAFS